MQNFKISRATTDVSSTNSTIECNTFAESEMTIDITGYHLTKGSEEQPHVVIELNRTYDNNEVLVETFDPELVTQNPLSENGSFIFGATALDAIQIAQEIIKVSTATLQRNAEHKSRMVAFKNAQLDCLRGNVGRLEIELTSESDVLGFAYYTLKYFSDVVQDNIVLHELNDVHLFFPTSLAELIWEQLRSLVGGNHQYTQGIAISTTNFEFPDLS